MPPPDRKPISHGDAKKHVDARIAARRADPANPVRKWDFVKFGPHGIEAVHCKECGRPIKGLVVDDRFSETRIINGKTIVFQRLVLAELPGYSEIEIEFDDGSRHITHVCKGCLPKLTPNDLDALYEADMDMWSIEAARDGVEYQWERFAERRASKHRKVR